MQLAWVTKLLPLQMTVIVDVVVFAAVVVAVLATPCLPTLVEW